MFLVEQHDSPFTDKLQRLGYLLTAIPTVVLITLRDPREGLPSLYQELYSELPLLEQLSFARFCRGAQARCYDYAYLLRTLEKVGFSDIRVLEYEQLISENVLLSDLLGDNSPSTFMLRLSHANASPKMHDNKRILRPISMISVMNSIKLMRFVQGVLNSSGLRGTTLHQNVIDLFTRISFPMRQGASLHLPKSVDKQFVRGFTQARLRLRKSE